VGHLFFFGAEIFNFPLHYFIPNASLQNSLEQILFAGAPHSSVNPNKNIMIMPIDKDIPNNKHLFLSCFL